MSLRSQSAAAAREEANRTLGDARKVESEHAQRLKKIQADLSALRAKEKQISQVCIHCFGFFTFIEKITVYLYFCDRNALRLLGRSRSWSSGEGQSCASTARLRSRTRHLRVSTSLTWLNSVWEHNLVQYVWLSFEFSPFFFRFASVTTWWGSVEPSARIGAKHETDEACATAVRQSPTGSAIRRRSKLHADDRNRALHTTVENKRSKGRLYL